MARAVVLAVPLLVWAAGCEKSRRSPAPPPAASTPAAPAAVPPGPVAELRRPVPSVTLEVDVAADGSLAVAGRAVTLPELETLCRSVHAQSADAQLVIRGDRQATHARVVEVIQAAKHAGITRLALAVAGP